MLFRHPSFQRSSYFKARKSFGSNIGVFKPMSKRALTQTRSCLNYNPLFHRPQSLIDFCKEAIEAKKYEYALSGIKYCKEMDRLDVISALAKEYKDAPIEDNRIRYALAIDDRITF